MKVHIFLFVYLFFRKDIRKEGNGRQWKSKQLKLGIKKITKCLTDFFSEIKFFILSKYISFIKIIFLSVFCQSIYTKISAL